MTYGKSSIRRSTIYTKAADLKRLEKELENLRQKRISRRHLQNLSLTMNDTVSILSETPLQKIELKGNIHDAHRKTSTMRTEQKCPSAQGTIALSKGLSTCNKQEKHANDLIVDVNSPTDQLMYAHEHSLLLKNLNLSTKAARRKVNRLKESKSKYSYSDEDDLTAELLRTAFQNLVPVEKSSNLRSDPSFSSPEKKFTSKKQSSLSKLRTPRGKVSATIDVFENGSSTTRHYKTNELHQSIAKSVSTTRRYQQSAKIDATLPSNTDTTTQSLSTLNRNHLPSQSPHLERKEISQPCPQPASTISRKHSNSMLAIDKRASLYTKAVDKRRYEQSQVRTHQNKRRLSVYTPQLSHFDCESHHDLSILCPLPVLLFACISAGYQTAYLPQSPNTEDAPDFSPPLRCNGARKIQSLQQTPNIALDRTQNDIDTGQLDAPTLIGKNATSESQLVYGFDVANDQNDIATSPDSNHGDSTDPLQQYMDKQVDIPDDASSDTVFSDDTDIDTDDMDENDKNNSPVTLLHSPVPKCKRYSSTYFDHYYDHHINTTTTIATTPHDHERQRNTSLKGISPNAPSPLLTTNTTTTDTNFVTNTHRFWDVFSAVMGQQQRSDATPLDQSGASKGQQGVKYLPTSWSQHQYNNASTAPRSSLQQPSPTTWSSHIPLHRQKSLTKSRRDHRSSSIYRSINKKPEAAYYGAISPGKESIPIFTRLTNYSSKVRTKRSIGYRASASLTKRMMKAAPVAPSATAQPKWRQPLHVLKHYSQ